MDDLISRQAAIDAIKNLCKECDSDHCGECRIDYPDKDAKSVLEALPPAQSEQKKGKWIEDKGQQTLMKNNIAKGEVWRVCSVCGAGHMIGHKYECDKAYHDTHHNFCPRCGADMREVTDGRD